jgi:ATP phosphoribosyltransferase regulatory subunit HisZ
MRELRAITDAVRGVFGARGYGEIATPGLEYEAVLTRGDAMAADPAYKLFDEHGAVLVLRSDMTIPIARVVATRYADAEPPLRFSYVAYAYRSVRPQRGQAREMLQAGIELVGAPGPEGTAEAITLLCESLDAVGLSGYRVGLGDASLFAGLVGDEGGKVLHELETRDFVGLERELTALGRPELLDVAMTRGGPEVLEREEASRLRSVYELLGTGVRERIIFDLGLFRPLRYYTGAIFEVYDEALGAPLGGGGRYDDLLGRFGRDLPAVGWALNVERLHIALVQERAR